MTAPAPNPFPFEDDDHRLPYRPPVHRPIHADDRHDSDTVLAAKLKTEATANPHRWSTTHANDWADIEATAARIRQQATPPGDPIMRWVTAAGLAIAVVFLMAAVTRSHYSGAVMLGCILAAIAVCAAGSIAYRITDRKAAQS